MPAVMISAWHQTPEDRYDFSASNQRIEVKSAAGRIRQHHFGLQQLHPPRGTNLLVASTFVESAGGGVSIAELADQVRSQIAGDPGLILLLDRIVGLTLGDNWRQASQFRFDKELAEQSLRCVKLKRVAFHGTVLVPPNTLGNPSPS